MSARVTTPPLQESFSAEDFTAALERSNRVGRPLSLVVHLPFCRQACDSWACHRIPSPDTGIVEPYLSRLDREMVLTSRHLDTSREVQQLLWGGGSPTFLTLAQMGDLIDRLNARFGLSDARERDYAIEIDPGETDLLTLRHLQALGFNRLSIDVRDIDPGVQKAINRIQPWGLTESLIDEAARLGFRSLNLDLVYGLPLQTPQSFARTLREVIAIAPARLTFFHHGHWHAEVSPRPLLAPDIPDTKGIQRILSTLHAMLSAAGYVHLGSHLFARPDDSLARSHHPGRLSQVFCCSDSSRMSCDRMGLGLSAVSRVDDVYAANARRLTDYEAALDSGRLPILGGLRLSDGERA
jgi:oxygen-independent coproporphyrinogen-3 oxidase